MIIHFRHVKLHNFSCYGDAELSLENMGYTIVSGVNNNASDNALSNGSGKSSIFNAICYAMTGETTQGLSNNIENIYTNPNDCWVELEFGADEDEFLIRRYKTPRPDLKIFVNGEDRSGKGIRESQQILEGYLPDLTSQLLGSIIILGQGLPYRFTHNTPSARKFLLEKLTKSDYMVQSVKDKLEARKEELKIQLRKFEDSDIANTTQTKIYYDQLNKLKKDLDEYEDCTKEGSIEDKLIDIKETLTSYSDEMADLQDKKIEKETQINRYLQQKTTMAQEDSGKMAEELIQIDALVFNVNAELVNKKSEAQSLEKEIKKLDSIVDVCPTCGQKIPDVHKIDTTDLKSKLKVYKSAVKALMDQHDALTNQKDDIVKSHSEALNAKYEGIDALINTTKLSVSSITARFNSLARLSQSLMREELRLNELQDRFSKLQEEIVSVTKKLEDLKEEKTTIEYNIKDLNEHLNVVQSLITLAKREFRSVLLENVVKYLDRKVKEYAVCVFGAEIMSIETDENYINVLFSNKYYEALSGGEKQKVDIIIQLALRDLLSNQLNLHANLFVLDEVLDFLDEKGADSILKLIQSSVSDISSVFVISHHAVELNISYDTLVEVVKGDDGVSTILVR